LLFSILTIVTGASSYLSIRMFIKTDLKRLNKAFRIDWQRPPTHTASQVAEQPVCGGEKQKCWRLL
jgi:hypothetical protein